MHKVSGNYLCITANRTAIYYIDLTEKDIRVKLFSVKSFEIPANTLLYKKGESL